MPGTATLMASPWTILGLEPSQHDERSIKRAYAKLLKQHRPDQDPEGFRRIHEAYQSALRMAEDDDEVDEDQSEVSSPPRPTPPPLVMPRQQDQLSAISAAIPAEPLAVASADTTTGNQSDRVAPEKAGVENSTESSSPVAAVGASDAGVVKDEAPTTGTVAPMPVRSRPRVLASSSPWELAILAVQTAAGLLAGDERTTILYSAFRRLATLAPDQEGRSEVVVRLLERHIPGGRADWRHIFSDDDLLAEMRHGSSDMTARTLKGCFEAGDWDRLLGFARRWLDEDADLHATSDARALSRVLAVWLAPVDYDLAKALAEQLPLDARRGADNELDTILVIGRGLSGLPADCRRYVSNILRGASLLPDEELRWRTAGQLSQLPSSSLVHRFLRERAPGHFDGVEMSPSTGLNLMTITFGIVGFLLWTVVVGVISALFTQWWAGAGSIILVCIAIALGVGIFLGMRWLYQQAKPWYATRLRPWIWRHAGPFDAVLLFSVLYVWLGIGILVRSRATEPPPLLVSLWVLVLPWVLVVVIHHLRRLLRRYHSLLPQWDLLMQEIRNIRAQASLDLERRQGWIELGNLMRRIVWLLPSAIGATVLIGGLAWCPALRPADETILGMVVLWWSATWVLTLLGWWAGLLAWRQQGHRPWWRPLWWLAWSVWLPAVVWLATMGIVWLGHAIEPAGPATAFTAAVLASCLPIVVKQRWRDRS